MVLVNKATNEVTVKLVYYGPGLCGKTTNLEHIYGNPKVENKGKMISMATETDRTLFFDFMPMELGTIGGQKVRVQLYTVPGQVFYDATRKLVLRGADGVVFVADSQQSMKDSNIESLENLKTNLRINRLNPDKIAIVYQANKRDLPNTSSVDEMKSYLGIGDEEMTEAVAIEGKGVAQTLRSAITKILGNLRNNVNYKLTEDEVAQMESEAEAEAAAEATEVPFPAAEAPAEETPATAPAPEAAPEAAPQSAPAAETPAADEASPFAEEQPAAASPFTGDVAALDDAYDGAELQALKVRTDELIRTLEGALELARKQEEQISNLIQKR